MDYLLYLNKWNYLLYSNELDGYSNGNIISTWWRTTHES